MCSFSVIDNSISRIFASLSLRLSSHSFKAKARSLYSSSLSFKVNSLSSSSSSASVLVLAFLLEPVHAFSLSSSSILMIFALILFCLRLVGTDFVVFDFLAIK